LNFKISADVKEDTLESIRTTLAFVLYGKIGSCFGYFPLLKKYNIRTLSVKRK